MTEPTPHGALVNSGSVEGVTIREGAEAMMQTLDFRAADRGRF